MLSSIPTKYICTNPSIQNLSWNPGPTTQVSTSMGVGDISPVENTIFTMSPDDLVEAETKFAHNRSGHRPKRYIQPFANGTVFHFRIDFTNLESDEFAALLFAITLEENMRHKLGYGKPLGLGTVALMPVSMTLIDYSARYTQPGTNKGKTTVSGDDVWQFIYKQSDLFYDTKLVTIAMEDLRRIWCWPPAAGVKYYYPSKRHWFDTKESIGKRIADTKNVP